MVKHYFKTHPEPFEAMWQGFKTADLRDLGDRPGPVEPGDRITFEEFDPETLQKVVDDRPGGPIRFMSAMLFRWCKSWSQSQNKSFPLNLQGLPPMAGRTSFSGPKIPLEDVIADYEVKLGPLDQPSETDV